MSATIRIASAGLEMTGLPILVAGALGYLDAEDLRVEFSGHNGGPDAARAVLDGEADLGIGGLWRPLMYRGRVVDLTVIGQIMARAAITLVRRRPREDWTAGHLAGTVVIDASAAPSPRALIEGLVSEAGEAPVRIITGLGAKEASSVFLGGLGDFLVASPTTATALVHKMGYGDVVSLGDIAGPIPWGVLYARMGRSGTEGDQVDRFLRATQRGRCWLDTASVDDLHSAPFREICTRDFQAAPDAITPLVLDLARQGTWSGSMVIDRAQQARWQQMLVSMGLIEAVFDPDQFIDENRRG